MIKPQRTSQTGARMQKEKVKATSSRSQLDSYFGDVLLKTNVHERKVLSSELSRLQQMGE